MDGPRSRRRDRRTFTRDAALALLGGATVIVSGCRTPASPSLPPPDPPAPVPTPAPPLTDKTGVFLANHRHTAVITAAQLTSGGGLLLDIRGDANHPHILELSAAEATSIGRGDEVGKESTEVKGHTHYVTFNPRETTGRAAG